MEQRIGPIIPPVPAAGTDPGHIPGLTPPRPEESEEVTAEAKTAPDASEAPEAPEEAAGRPLDDTAEATAADTAADDADDDAPEPTGEAAAGDQAEDGDEAEDGPVFDVSDRRGSITAGRSGVAFQLDGESAEFSWDEIGAVEIDTPRFGRRFSVTVYTTAHRWYAADVEASARGALKEWTARLDEVLDAYFEDTAEK